MQGEKHKKGSPQNGGNHVERQLVKEPSNNVDSANPGVGAAKKELESERNGETGRYLGC